MYKIMRDAVVRDGSIYIAGVNGATGFAMLALWLRPCSHVGQNNGQFSEVDLDMALSKPIVLRVAHIVVNLLSSDDLLPHTPGKRGEVAKGAGNVYYRSACRRSLHGEVIGRFSCST